MRFSGRTPFLRLWSGILSLLLGAALVYALLRFGRVDLAALATRLAAAPAVLPAILAGTAASAWLSARRWQIVAGALGLPAVPGRAAFGLTAIGGALGQILPVPVATASARALGARLFEPAGPAWRHAEATFYEQAADLLLVCTLASASGLAWALGGGGTAWLLAAGAALAASWLGAGVAGRLGASAILDRRLPALAARIHVLSRPALLRQLLGLSLGRFAILVIMLAVIAGAIGLPVPLWHLGAAAPVALLAGAVLPVPAGLGANEWALASSLALTGTPMDAAIAVAVAARLLSGFSALTLGGAACGAMAAAQFCASSRVAPTRP